MNPIASFFARLFSGWSGAAAPAAPAAAPAMPVVAIGERVSTPPVNTAPPLPSVVPGALAAEALAPLCRAAGYADPVRWAGILAAPMARYAIVGPRRVAAFLANTAHETGGGSRLVESLDYAPDRLRAVFGARATPEALARCRQPGRPADQAGLANILYGGEWGRRNLGNTQPGDGWLFRGRGLIQVTGRTNYERVAGLLDRGLAEMMAAMETPAGAAETAAAWWSAAGVNDLADRGDVEAVRRRVNGGVVGLPEVRRRYADVLAAMGAG